MSLSPGSRLGPYEILAPLGAGGMGEVYRAKDSRLGRDVAIKVLPASFSADGDRLRRFEQEARAAGILNHPNITAVYDIGADEAGAPYVVTELLEGETLRSRMAGGAPSPRKSLEYALQIAHGLAAAHEKGIVHRDLKPENLFVTKDGRVKILDFGLAKLTHTEGGGQVTNLPTATAGTEPGVVLGTLGYMSPEQVRGRPADARSDIFSFGAILYEMLSGKRAFHGDSAADTMSAILREDPPDLSVTNQNISPGLERVVRHCLEKNPEERFHSAHDLAFDLESLSDSSGVRASALPASPRRSAWMGRALASAVALALALLAGHFLWRSAPPSPSFRRITFRRGNIGSARFAPDGQSAVYSAAFGSSPLEVFSARFDSPESVALGFRNADLFGVSPTSELALSIRDMNLKGAEGTGTLARAPLGGGAPREVLEFVNRADWGTGGTLAIVRGVEGRERIEYPIGRKLYETRTSAIYYLRVSPSGDRIAFLESRGDEGVIGVVDLAGHSRILHSSSTRIARLAWSPNGREIWYDERGPHGEGRLTAVDLSGRSRTILRSPISLMLHDISKDGRVLLERYTGGSGILCLAPGFSAERELGWFDGSRVKDVTPDGALFLFNETGDATGGESAVYIRKPDGSPAVKLADGVGETISADGRFVLVRRSDAAGALTLIPTRTGTPVAIDRGGLEKISAAELFPDGRRVLMAANLAGGERRLYVQEIPAGKPGAISPPGFSWSGHPISADGKWVVGFRDWSEDLFLFSTEGAAARPIPNTKKLDPVRWSSDGRSLFVADSGTIPARIHRLDVQTGSRTLWRELAPPEALNVIRLNTPAMTPDGRVYAYSYSRAATSDLFVVEGLR